MGFPALGGADEGVYAIRPYLAGRKKEPSLGFPIPEKNGIQKCTRKPLADTNRKEQPLGFPALGGEGEEAYAIRPYAFGRKKEPSLGFLALGGEGKGAYAIRPYPFGRKKDCPFSFLIPKKAGIQKCTPKPSADTNRKERSLGFPVLGGEDEGAYAIPPYAFDRKKD